MKKYIVEFIGTFFLVLGAILGQAVGAALALMVMIYAGGHISGAHYNPAVTIAMYIRKKISAAEIPGYIVAQLAGSVVAAFVGLYLMGSAIHAPACDFFSFGKLALGEVLGTFALVYVIMNVATAKGTANNSFYGLAIAGTVLAMAVAFGNFSGAVFNPAVAVALAIYKTLCWQNLWIYFVAQLLAAAFAAYTFLAVNEADEEPESIPDERTVRD